MFQTIFVTEDMELPIYISYMTIKILLVDLNKLWTKYTPLKHNIVKASDNYNKQVLIDYKL